MPEYREIDEIILQHLMKNSGISSSEIHTGIGQIVGYATTKRVLQNLLSEGLIRTTGKGKSTNAVLLNEGFCPLSFRTIDSIDYKKAMLIFNEQNNINSFKRIFIDQFEFAVKTYF